MYRTSYWNKENENIEARPKLQGERKTDVAIIGAGFTGLSSAVYLREHGYETIVVDKMRVGEGASGRNGSLMLIGYKKSLVYITKKYGIQVAKEMLQMSLDGINLLKKMTEENNIECELMNNGSLFAAYKPKHFENLKKEQEFMYEYLEYENYIVEPEDIRTEINSPLYHGGLVDPNSYYFHPFKYVTGLARTVEEKGGEIYENTEITRIEKKNGLFHICSDEGTVIAKELIVATNGYTTDLTKPLARAIVPMNSNMIATEPLGEEVRKSLIPKNRGVFDTKNLLYYFRFSVDNRLLFGSRVPGPEDEVLYGKLRSAMIKVFPSLKDAKIEYKWGGKLAVTMDMLPHVGQLNNGAYFALGYSGHGVSLSTLMGKIISENIVSKNRKKTIFETLPLKPIPLTNQRALIVNLATNYFNLKDKIS